MILPIRAIEVYGYNVETLNNYNRNKINVMIMFDYDY